MKRHINWITVFLIICFLVVSAPANPSMPDLVMTKTAYVSSVLPGDVFTYNLYVINYSLYSANDVYIIDGLPVGLILQSWTLLNKTSDIYDVKYNGNGVWIPLDGSLNRANLDILDDIDLDITVQLDPLYTGDEIINTAWAMSMYDLDYSNNESTLILTVIPAPGAILLGGIGVGLVGWLRRRRTIQSSSPCGITRRISRFSLVLRTAGAFIFVSYCSLLSQAPTV